jgi:hypothetical protein
MTFEQYDKAEKLMQQYSDVLDKLQKIRNNYINDESISFYLDECYFKLKDIFNQKLKDI